MMDNVKKWNEGISELRESNISRTDITKVEMKRSASNYNDKNLHLLKDLEGNFKITRLAAGESRYIVDGVLCRSNKEYHEQTGKYFTGSDFITVYVAYTNQLKQVSNFLSLSVDERVELINKHTS